MCIRDRHCDVGQKIAITWLAADYITQHAVDDWVFDYSTTGNDQMYWEANRNKLTYVGTSDEIVPFNSLPLGLLSEALAGALVVRKCEDCDSDDACEDGDYCLVNGDCDGGSCDNTNYVNVCDDGSTCNDDDDCAGDETCDNVYVATSAADGFESCGSPGEVASDPSLGTWSMTANMDKRTARSVHGPSFRAALAEWRAAAAASPAVAGAKGTAASSGPRVAAYVRKRPLADDEATRGEYDALDASGTAATVHACLMKPDMRRMFVRHSKFALTGAAFGACLLYTSPSPRDATLSRMPASA